MAISELDSFGKKYKALIEDRFRESINELQSPSILKEAMLYSLEAGGKRIRPLLLFATIEAFEKDPEVGLPAAAAIEMIHTYSLIHDDLPSMDDDDLRRGKPTNHKVFGEANAILAGDALLTYSFEMMTGLSDVHVSPRTKLELIKLVAQSSGAEGMVGGQVADMLGEEKELSLEELEYVHIHKTGKILTCSVLAGALIAGANEEQMEYLRKFSFHLGLAFQIRDDLLDISGNEELLGKRVGSDEANHKSTYPSLLGMEGAKKELDQHISLAKKSLAKLGKKTTVLELITDLIANRNN